MTTTDNNKTLLILKTINRVLNVNYDITKPTEKTIILEVFQLINDEYLRSKKSICIEDWIIWSLKLPFFDKIPICIKGIAGDCCLLKCHLCKNFFNIIESSITMPNIVNKWKRYLNYPDDLKLHCYKSQFIDIYKLLNYAGYSADDIRIFFSMIDPPNLNIDDFGSLTIDDFNIRYSKIKCRISYEYFIRMGNIYNIPHNIEHKRIEIHDEISQCQKDLIQDYGYLYYHDQDPYYNIEDK